MGRRRGQAYPQDLRDRVLAAVGEPIRSVAARLHVSPSYVSKVQSRLPRLRLTGKVAAGPQRNHTRPRLEPFYDALRACCRAGRRDLAELRAWLLRERGVSVSHAVMWETLIRLWADAEKSASARPSRTAPISPRRAMPGPRCSPSSARAG